ncbi:hypothetical protein GINT2_000169 [Glugoides intestinalis]
MDYRILGVYNEKKNEIFGNTFLYTFEGKKYEIEEFEIYKNFQILSNKLHAHNTTFPLERNHKSIVVTDKLVFICYEKILDVYNKSGEIIKRLSSENYIRNGTGGFFIMDEVTYIVNFDGDTIFSRASEEVLDFMSNGNVLSITNFQVNESKDDNYIPDASYPVKRNCLVIENCKKKVEYNHEGDILFSLQGYKVYNKMAKIMEVISCSSMELEVFNSEGRGEITFRTCAIILSKAALFLIFDDIIVEKSLDKEFVKIVPERAVVHNYVKEGSFYDCLILLACFKEIKLYEMKEVEEFMVALINSDQKREFVEKLIKSLEMSTRRSQGEFYTILCRVYRQTDDNNREFLEQFIDIDKLDADTMFYIIIYKPDYTEKFIRLCKAQERLFYLEDLRSFFEKTDRVDECRQLFLENGILMFEYKGLEKFNRIEKMQIESQRMRYKLKCLIS